MGKECSTHEKNNVWWTQVHEVSWIFKSVRVVAKDYFESTYKSDLIFGYHTFSGRTGK